MACFLPHGIRLCSGIKYSTNLGTLLFKKVTKIAQCPRL